MSAKPIMNLSVNLAKMNGIVGTTIVGRLQDFEKFCSNLRVEEGSLLGVGAVQRHIGNNPL
jgi:hypothetical protein